MVRPPALITSTSISEQWPLINWQFMPDIYRALHKIVYSLLIIDFVIIASVIAGLSWLHLNGNQLLSVQTASMKPVLNAGDAIITKSDTNIVPGEIISYYSPLDSKVVISHRLVKSERNGQLITAGDVTGSNDVPFSKSNVIGHVIMVLPGFGYFLNSLRKPVSLALLIYMPAIILLFKEINRLNNHLNRPYYQLLSHR